MVCHYYLIVDAVACRLAIGARNATRRSAERVRTKTEDAVFANQCHILRPVCIAVIVVHPAEQAFHVLSPNQSSELTEY